MEAQVCQHFPHQKEPITAQEAWNLTSPGAIGRVMGRKDSKMQHLNGKCCAMCEVRGAVGKLDAEGLVSIDTGRSQFRM